MKKFLHSRYGASKGAALIIVLAFVVLVTGLAIAHFSRTTTDRQVAQSSYNDTSADLLARSALDITVSDLKQEIASKPVTVTNIQPQRSGDDASIPNLIRRSVYPDLILAPGVSSLASNVSSGPVVPTDPKRGEITPARWNSHYLIPSGANFTAPNWVLVTRAGPAVFAAWQNSLKDPISTNTNYVVGRYAFAVYDEGGLINVNVGGFPTYASVTRPTRPARRLAPTYPVEESEIMLAAFTPKVPCPKFNQSGQLPRTIPTGAPFSFTPGTNHNGGTFSANFLPHGLSIDASTGTVFGIPTSPGTFNIILSVTAPGCSPDTSTWQLTVTGLITPDPTPWPVNVARKGTLAFADLTALPSTPAITTAQINQLMGWRNYATTQRKICTPVISWGGLRTL
jgi:hypothetical protein